MLPKSCIIYIYRYVCVYPYIYLYIYTHACEYVYSYTTIYIYIYIICMYIHIYYHTSQGLGIKCPAGVVSSTVRPSLGQRPIWLSAPRRRVNIQTDQGLLVDELDVFKPIQAIFGIRCLGTSLESAKGPSTE